MLKKLESLIELSYDLNKTISIIFINGSKDYTEAASGYLEPDETKEINYYFSNSFSNYYFYNNPSTFVGDIVLNKIRLGTKYNFLYSTAQIGRDINRRSFIPNFSTFYNILPITCNSYGLSLLQNKKHYYQLSSKFCSIPKTLVYTGINSVNEALLDGDHWFIIKPNIECAAKGVKLLKSPKEILAYSEELFRKLNQEILIQEFIEGTEIEVPVVSSSLDTIPLSPIALRKKGKYLTASAVDKEEYSFYKLEHDLIPKIQNSAKNIIENLGCTGICRVDFILKEDGSLWLFDIAAIPLITKHSSCAFAFNLLFPNCPETLYHTMVGAKLSELICPITYIRKHP